MGAQRPPENIASVRVINLSPDIIDILFRQNQDIVEVIHYQIFPQRESERSIWIKGKDRGVSIITKAGHFNVRIEGSQVSLNMRALPEWIEKQKMPYTPEIRITVDKEGNVKLSSSADKFKVKGKASATESIVGNL